MALTTAGAAYDGGVRWRKSKTMCSDRMKGNKCMIAVVNQIYRQRILCPCLCQGRQRERPAKQSTDLQLACRFLYMCTCAWVVEAAEILIDMDITTRERESNAELQPKESEAREAKKSIAAAATTTTIERCMYTNEEHVAYFIESRGH